MECFTNSIVITEIQLGKFNRACQIDYISLPTVFIILFNVHIFLLLHTYPGEEADDADLDAPKIYEPIDSFEQLDAKLLQYMQQYNETVRGGQMDLVFFKVSL